MTDVNLNCMYYISTITKLKNKLTKLMKYILVKKTGQNSPLFHIFFYIDMGSVRSNMSAYTYTDKHGYILVSN